MRMERRKGAGRALATAALCGALALTACGQPAKKSDAPPAIAQSSSAAPAETLPGRVPVFAGTYTATLPAADAPGREITLALKADMSATLTTVFAGKGEPIVEQGTWSFHDVEITLQPAAKDGAGAPMPLIWNCRDGRLVPKAWNHALYGSVGLPMEKRS